MSDHYRQRPSSGKANNRGNLLRNLSSSEYDGLLNEQTALVPQRAAINRTESRPATKQVSRREDRLASSIESDHGDPIYTPKLPSCQQMWCSRRPKGKAVFLVLIIQFLEAFAFYTTLDTVQLLDIFRNNTWLYVLLYTTTGRVLYPLAGMLADTYLGRYTVIHIGLWLYWLTLMVLSLLLAISPSPGHTASIVVLIIVAVLFSAASGCVQANIIPFGVDQLSQGAPSTEMSSYFYWFYFAKNSGAVASIVVFLLIFKYSPDMQTILNRDYNLRIIQPMVAILLITIAMVLYYCSRNHYYVDDNRENPLKLVIKVLFHAATVKRQLPKFRRAFRFGEGKKPRIELAKMDYDGIYTGEEVENVKTFCRIILVIYSLGGSLVSYAAVWGMLSYQLSKHTSNVSQYGKQHPFLGDNMLLLINASVILICLPILNHIILVCLPNTNIRLRLGLGSFFIFLSSLVAGFLNWSFTRNDSMQEVDQFLWLVLPTIIFSIGELLLIVTALEFIYAQSPNSMKGFLTGLLYLALGIFGGGANMFFYKYPTTMKDMIAPFYFIISVVGVVGFISYTIVACLYRNRERPTTDDSEGETMRRIHAQSVFSQRPL